MAEDTTPEPEAVDPNTTATAAVDMEVENVDSAENGSETNNQKRAREEGEAQEGKDDDVSKKQKVDEEKSVEEQRLEKTEEPQEEQTEEKEGEKEPSGPVSLGPKSFESSVEMFNYFYNFLHAWPPYLNVNKYEHITLLELLKKGHAESAKKIGGGIRAFQIRKHPAYKSRCFFLIREDDSVDDFSFRKCVDHILPLPEDMHVKSDVNKALGGGGGGGKHHGGGRGGRGRGGGGRGHGRGGRWRR